MLDEIGISRSTAHRIRKRLVAEGYITEDGAINTAKITPSDIEQLLSRYSFDAPEREFNEVRAGIVRMVATQVIEPAGRKAKGLEEEQGRIIDKAKAIMSDMDRHEAKAGKHEERADIRLRRADEQGRLVKTYFEMADRYRQLAETYFQKSLHALNKMYDSMVKLEQYRQESAAEERMAEKERAMLEKDGEELKSVRAELSVNTEKIKRNQAALSGLITDIRRSRWPEPDIDL